MTKKHLCALLLVYFALTVHATKPGAKLTKIDEKQLVVHLYLVSVSFKEGKLMGAKFVWLPQDIKSKCLGKTLKEDQKIDRQNRKKSRIPRRLLTTWITPQSKNKEIIKTLEKLKFIAKHSKTKGEHHLKVLNAKKAIKALIHWELWPNGENFRILKTPPPLKKKKKSMALMHFGIGLVAFVLGIFVVLKRL